MSFLARVRLTQSSHAHSGPARLHPVKKYMKQLNDENCTVNLKQSSPTYTVILVLNACVPTTDTCRYMQYHIDGSVQDCSISSANVLEIIQSYTKTIKVFQDQCYGGTPLHQIWVHVVSNQ